MAPTSPATAEARDDLGEGPCLGGNLAEAEPRFPPRPDDGGREKWLGSCAEIWPWRRLLVCGRFENCKTLELM